MLQIDSSFIPGSTTLRASSLASPVSTPSAAAPGVMAARVLALAQGLIVRVQLWQ
jgi:hypothetical protein